MNIPLETLITEKEAAIILCVAVATLRRWRWACKGPQFRKIGGAVRYALSDLQAFVEEAARYSTSDPGPGVVARSTTVTCANCDKPAS